MLLSDARGHAIIPDEGRGPLMEAWLERVRELPFVLAAEALPLAVGLSRDLGVDGRLRIRTPTGDVEFLVVRRRSSPTLAVLRAIAERLGALAEPCVLLAPYVGRKAAQELRQLQLNYMDSVGNCRLAIGDRYIAHVEGRRPPALPSSARGLGVAGYQVYFGLLADPALRGASVRRIAEAAGVGKTAVADALRRLEADGILVQTRSGRRLLEPRRLTDRWLEGYAALVRPRTEIGRYRTVHGDPPSLEAAVEAQLGSDAVWGWGGTAAAARLTQYYRGRETVLHIQDPPTDLATRLKALPAEDGSLRIFKTPGTVAYEGAIPHTVHPLLVYGELLAGNDARAHKAAEELRERFLGPSP